MKLIIALLLFANSLAGNVGYNTGYNAGYNAGIEHAIYTAQPDFEAQTITFDGMIYNYE